MLLIVLVFRSTLLVDGAVGTDELFTCLPSHLYSYSARCSSLTWVNVPDPPPQTLLLSVCNTETMRMGLGMRLLLHVYTLYEFRAVVQLFGMHRVASKFCDYGTLIIFLDPTPCRCGWHLPLSQTSPLHSLVSDWSKLTGSLFPPLSFLFSLGSLVLSS